MKVIVNSDGGSKGNPGPAGYGVIIRNDIGQVIHQFGEYIGVQTNNIAEYIGAIQGIKKALSLGASECELRCDSQLVAYQYLGYYKVSSSMYPYAMQLRELGASFKNFVVTWVRREQNQLADKECNLAIHERRFKDDRGNHELCLSMK